MGHECARVGAGYCKNDNKDEGTTKLLVRVKVRLELIMKYKSKSRFVGSELINYQSFPP